MSGDMIRLYFWEVRFLIWSSFLQGQPQRSTIGEFHAPSRQRHMPHARKSRKRGHSERFLPLIFKPSKVFVSVWTIENHGVACKWESRVVTFFRLAALKLSWLSKDFRSTQLSSRAYNSPSQDIPMFFRCALKGNTTVSSAIFGTNWFF